MTALIVNQQIVHYEVLGRGRPLVFLHGWVGSWRDWLATMQALSSTYRCYALDLWGYGDTAKAPDRYTLEAQTALVADFLAALGIGKIALLGHGLGAFVGARFADEFPESVDRVLLVGFATDPQDLNERFTTASPAELVAWLYGSSGSSSAVEAVRREAAKMDSNALRAAIKEISQNANPVARKQPAFHQLFVFGEGDPAGKPPADEFMANSAYQTHYILLENGGHFPMLSQAEKFSRLVTDFLALQPEESPKDLQLKAEWKRRFR